MKYILLGILLIAIGQMFAQPQANIVEHFTPNEEAITARSMGLAGAFGAVGADFSSATHNPAGVAFFRKKELGLNLGYNMNDYQTSYLTNVNEANRNTLRLNNIAYVHSNLQTEWKNDSLVVKREGIVSWSITLGMNQSSELNSDLSYSSFNPNHSLLSSYVNSANQFASTDISQLSIYQTQAINTNLLNVDQSGTTNQFSSPIQTGNILQSERIIRSGARREYYLAGGVNLSNKLYLGATIGMPTVNFEENRFYKEEDSQNNYTTFSSLSLNDEREYTSVGGYLGLGAVYRFNDYIRAGLHVKTPTALEVEETTQIQTSNATLSDSDQFEDIYIMTLPWESGLQLVGSHPKYGLISLEGEFIDYRSTRINYEEDLPAFKDAEEVFKNDIQGFYKGVFNFRGGLEARLYKNLRLRGGFAHHGSPYKNEEDQYGATYSQQTYALGAGYRFEPSNITVDLGFNHNKTGQFNSPYLIFNQPVSAISDITSNQIRLGISKRFNQ